jgi:hypothetical protein
MTSAPDPRPTSTTSENPMHRTRHLIAGLTACLVAASVLAAPTLAQTEPPTQTTPTTTTQTAPTGATVAIDNCHVKRSRNSGGYTWFYCGVVADVPVSGSISVAYRANLTTFKPGTGGSWRSRSGTLRFTSGQSLANVKFAVRNRTVAQVRQTLRVTLSNAQGATIIDAPARAAAS